MCFREVVCEERDRKRENVQLEIVLMLNTYGTGYYDMLGGYD